MNVLTGVEHMLHIKTQEGAVPMSTTAQVATPSQEPVVSAVKVDIVAAPTSTHHTGQIIDTILHDVLYAGSLAAMFFVKNPASQQKAAVLANGLQQLLAFLDPQLTGVQPTSPTQP